MKIITVKEFLEEMKKDWDCVDMYYFNYQTKDLIHREMNKSTIKYDKKYKSMHFKDWKYDLENVIPMKNQILVDKYQYSLGEYTDYIINLTDDIDITFRATERRI